MRCKGCREEYAASMLGLVYGDVPRLQIGYCPTCREKEAWKPNWLKRLEQGQKITIGRAYNKQESEE